LIGGRGGRVAEIAAVDWALVFVFFLPNPTENPVLLSFAGCVAGSWPCEGVFAPAGCSQGARETEVALSSGGPTEALLILLVAWEEDAFVGPSPGSLGRRLREKSFMKGRSNWKPG